MSEIDVCPCTDCTCQPMQPARLSLADWFWIEYYRLKRRVRRFLGR